jgi:uncharacterized repeat protein (TIGR01451 family)
MQAAGEGIYTVANVGLATGEARFAGWALVVVYQDPAAPARNLTVWDGYADVRPGESATIDIENILTPSTGPVAAAIGVAAQEGDRGSVGDSVSLNGTPLSDAITPPNNFFNSQFSHLGAVRQGRQPDHLNTFGFEGTVVDATGIIPPGATSATLTLQASSGVYYPGVVTTAIDLLAPEFPADTKSVTGMSQGTIADAGDILTYTIVLENIGGDDAIGSILTDPLSPDLAFVPGSLTIDGVVMTDAAGDDQAEFNGTDISYRLGAGANAANGGTLAMGATTTVTFQAEVVTPGALIVNQASLAYTASVSGFDLVYLTNQTTTPVVPVADIVVEKTQTADQVGRGESLIYEVTVTNDGPSDTTGVVLTDLLPASVTFVAATPAQGTYDLISGLWTVGDLAAGGSATLTIETAVTAGALGTIVNTAAASSDLEDPDLANNRATSSATVVLEADLALTKTVTPASASVGDQVTYTMTITNNGADEATAVVVQDVLPAGVTFVSAAPTAGTFDSASGMWVIPQVAAGGTEQLDITVVADQEGDITNTATALANEPDPDPDNGVAGVTITIQQVVTTTTASTTTTSTSTTTTPPTTTTTGSPTTTQAVAGGDLADTGRNFAAWLWAAVGLVVGGAVLVVVARR